MQIGYSTHGLHGELAGWIGGYVAHQRDGWNQHSDYDKVSLTARADYMLGARTEPSTTFSTNHLTTETDGSLDSLNFYERGFTSLQTFTNRGES